MPQRSLLPWTLLFLLACSTSAFAIDRSGIDAEFRKALLLLAAKCDELKLPAEAAETRAWIIERLPDRQYLFVPPTRGPETPKDELKGKWHERFMALRRARAENLFALSKAYLDAGDGTRAYQALHETLREDPEHADARAILGFRKAGGDWRVPGASLGTRKASLGHAFVKDFKAGSYWRVTTSHFQVSTNAGPEAGQQFADQLETLHTVWRQVFFRYWSSTDDLKARFARPVVAERPRKPYDVVLFKKRDDYLANVVAIEPMVAMTQGFYADKKSAAFFYLGDPRTTAICNHEVTHQLFQETGDAAREIGAVANFWIVEGIALYMESLRTFERGGMLDHVTLGGWDADRLQFARHHVFNGQFQMPLEKLAGYSREGLQKDPDIKRLYSQSAGVAHYLMDGDGGRHRDATITYIAGVYAGRGEKEALAQLTDTRFAAHDEAYRQYLTVNDDHLARLDAPQRVRNLCLGHQKVTDRGVAKLGECANLEWLDLASVPVTDTGLAPLAKLKKLDQLNLENTAIGDATLAWLGKQTQLRELDLSHTKATDAGVAKLAPLTNLEVLWLTGTSVTDASAPVLARFKKLTTLDLEGTQLSPATIQKLRTSLPSLNPEP